MVPSPAPAGFPEACIVPAEAPGTGLVTLAALDEADSALIARQLLDPLIRLDCGGTARPAAAQSWAADSTGRRWTFLLSPAVAGITAGQVAAEWRTRPGAATTLRLSGVTSVIPLDEQRLEVTLDRASDLVPRLFADSTLGIRTDSVPRTLVLADQVTSDPRDALDAGAGLIRSGDPAFLEYARTRTDYTVHPLPWSHTYVLLIPPGQKGFGALLPTDSAAFRAGLARDAVRVDARGAQPPFWWKELSACPEPEPLPPTRGAVGRGIVARAWDDPVARALAERIVALSDRPMSVTGLRPRSPILAIHSEFGQAYVVAVPRVALVPCREIAGWPPGTTIVPLIDTRSSAVVRRGVPRLGVEFDGGVYPVEAP